MSEYPVIEGTYAALLDRALADRDEARAQGAALRRALQTILDMGCPLVREGDPLAAAQRIASEAITADNLALNSKASCV
jgi:hypothetical protein